MRLLKIDDFPSNFVTAANRIIDCHSNMALLTILQLFILITHDVYGFVPRGDFVTSAKAATSSLQQQNVRPNDIAVYDPGVGE